MTHSVTHVWRRLFASSIVFSFVIQAAVTCTNVDQSGEAMPKKDINAVMEAHTKSLMEIPGVVGVAIGELEDKTPCILVLVIEQSPELDAKLPKTLEGHPVQILETGEIKPLSDE